MPKPVSGYRFHAKLEMSDGTELDIRTKLTDVLRWEKDNGGQGFLVFPMPLDRLLWVFWAAGKRLGLVTGIDQPGWASQVVDFELVDDELDIQPEVMVQDPTPTAP
jgi:hypothetical protein